MSPLAAAQAARAEAAAALEAATGALERGRHAHEAAVAELARVEAAESAWVEREARRLRSAFVSGHQTPPTLVPDGKAERAHSAAAVNMRATAVALEQLTQDEQEMRQALQAAEAAVAAEEQAERDAQEAEIADQMETHLAELSRLGAVLRRWRPDGLNVPLNQLSRSIAPPRIQNLLDVLGRIEESSNLNTPLNVLRGEVPQEAAA